MNSSHYDSNCVGEIHDRHHVKLWLLLLCNYLLRASSFPFNALLVLICSNENLRMILQYSHKGSETLKPHRKMLLGDQVILELLK